MPVLRANPRFIGVNTQQDASELDLRHAVDALNVNLNRGTLQKRDGYTEETDLGASAILGLFDFRRTDGKVQTLIKHGSELHVREGGSNTSLATGLSATELASFAVHSDRAYLVDGANLKVSDGTEGGTRDAQLTRPAAAPAVALAGAGATAGVMTGTYDYKITYYSESFGQESPASDASATITTDAQQVTLSGLVASSQADVTKTRIYRRKESASEALWYFVKEVADTESSATDDTLDVDVSTTDIAPLSFEDDALPDFRHLEQHSGVMFLAGDDDKLYFTLPDKPWGVSNFLRVGGEGGMGKITGLTSFHGLLVVWKEDSIWTLSGITEDTFNARLILNGVGCAGGHSIVAAGDLLYFLGEDGIYVFDGSRALKVSGAIEPDLLARNRARDKYCVGAMDDENQAIIWSFTTSSSATANDTVFVFFAGNSARTEERSWCKWEFDSGLTSIARVTTNETDRDRKVWYGFANGVVGEPGSSSDGTAGAIDFRWQTSKWDGEAPQHSKAWGELLVELVPQTNTSYLEVRYYRDSHTSHEFIDAIDPQDAVHSLRVSDRSRDIRIEFYQTSTEALEVVGFSLEGHGAGRAIS